VNPIARRRFLISSGALLASPLARAEQPGRQYLVGALISGGRVDWDLYRTALRERLASHGFVEGRNLRIEDRFGFHQDGALVATREFVAMKVDAIFACTNSTMIGVKAATQSVPVVFTWVSDPTRMGLMSNLARPGGNITGVASRDAELMQKRFELALELAPGAKRIAVVVTGVDRVFYDGAIRPLLAQAAARSGVELLEVEASSREQAIDQAHQGGAKVVLTTVHFIRGGHRNIVEALIRRSLERRVALIAFSAQETEAGGLISYGSDSIDELQRAADMLAKVLKGTKPSDLAVDVASRFELVVNLKTAKAIGLTVPQSIMLRADRVIE
jgi:putative ABC transport system substrate-binding protein